MVRALDLSVAAKGFAAGAVSAQHAAPGTVVGFVFVFVAAVAIVAMAAFGCADGASGPKRRSHWGGGGAGGGAGCGGGGGGCGGGGGGGGCGGGGGGC
ncbi:hypothetical protein BRADI_5g24331v3 [Brachypodium distachyon]|uniref:Glycine-rich protein n=1 Tax=Brachypodium distachyon TaxID=15368 RepID=A0A2K2CJ21_BRADI|nr:hypothetical protein BRADI_5g24331v3 [Brachypodium distachyon]